MGSGQRADEPELAAEIAAEVAQQYGVSEEGSIRVDRWLWAARVFKTRSQAAKACVAGHVKLDGESLKAAKAIGVGDCIEVRAPGGRRVLVVRRICGKRGPASVARALYDDWSPPPPPREERAFGARPRGAGRPVKRERRRLDRMRGR